jgi:outer membrane protein insertion porin family
MLSFLTRKDVYDEDKLRADEELLRRFYYNRGYADFRVISSFAELDEANNEYVVTITVEEGERYVFGDVSIESTVPGIDSESLKGLIETRSGAVYSAKDVEDTILAISDRVATQGYPFAQITPRGDRDYNNRTISVVYLVDEGTRAYVERIEIRGNTRTRDYVIRREFDLSEGDAFNQVLVRRAKKRLEDLKFFSSVDISTQPGSQPDRVVLIVDVKDQSTGEFGVGGGYSNGDGFTATVDITERNFLGRGQFIRASVGGGEDSREYSSPLPSRISLVTVLLQALTCSRIPTPATPALTEIRVSICVSGRRSLKISICRRHSNTPRPSTPALQPSILSNPELAVPFNRAMPMGAMMLRAVLHAVLQHAG